MTKTAISNVALRAIGVGTIDDIDDDNDDAQACRDLIDAAAERVLCEVIIPALVTRQPLVAAGTPVDGYSSAYVLPTAPPVLLPLRLASKATFYREGATISTDDGEAVLVYVRADFDIEDLPAYIGETIGLSLAESLCAALGKDERFPLVASRLAAAIRQAKAIEGRYLNPVAAPKLWGKP